MRPTRSSALRGGIAFIESGTLEVSGQAFVEIDACSFPITVNILTRSVIASPTPAAPAE